MITRSLPCSLLLLFPAHWPHAQPAAAQPVDLLITNARIVDGSGGPSIAGGVAVRDGKIVAVGNVGGVEATRTIDAAKRAVAPGFIDVHTHVDDGILKQPSAENFVRD